MALYSAAARVVGDEMMGRAAVAPDGDGAGGVDEVADGGGAVATDGDVATRLAAFA